MCAARPDTSFGRWDNEGGAPKERRPHGLRALRSQLSQTLPSTTSISGRTAPSSTTRRVPHFLISRWLFTRRWLLPATALRKGTARERIGEVGVWRLWIEPITIS